MRLSGSNIKKFLMFSQKNVFLIFQETDTLKKFLIFQETSDISGSNSPRSNNEKTHSEKIFVFQEELPKPQNPKFLILLRKTL